MPPLTPILALTRKELRELVHRPILIVTLILGPLIIMIIFGLGSSGTPPPPRAIVVVPNGQDQSPLLQEYQQQFDESLRIVQYTDDEAAARDQLRQNRIDAVLILPSSPFETIAGGQAATIRVLYNELDPLWRGLVPRFVRGLAGDINRAIFLQTATTQRDALAAAAADIDQLLALLEQAGAAANNADYVAVRQQVQEAQRVSDRLIEVLALLGAQGQPLQDQITRIRRQLDRTEQVLTVVEQVVATPTDTTASEQLGLIQAQRSLQGLRNAITSFVAVPPEVVIAPLTVETEYVAQAQLSFITFFAPAVMALLLQHIAVSLGALAFIRERLAGTFDLYTVAPIAPWHLLFGKFLAYVLFTFVIGLLLLGVLLWGMDVPLFGSVWRLLLTMFLVVAASVGLGLMLSLLAVSERQAVQFSMLALLGVVFFSGFALPLDTLRPPALTVAYLLPVTYGVILLQDIMLRGLPGSSAALLTLFAMALGLLGACLALLRWRTRAH